VIFFIHVLSKIKKNIILCYNKVIISLQKIQKSTDNSIDFKLCPCVIDYDLKKL